MWSPVRFVELAGAAVLVGAVELAGAAEPAGAEPPAFRSTPQGGRLPQSAALMRSPRRISAPDSPPLGLIVTGTRPMTWLFLHQPLLASARPSAGGNQVREWPSRSTARPCGR